MAAPWQNQWCHIYSSYHGSLTKWKVLLRKHEIRICLSKPMPGDADEVRGTKAWMSSFTYHLYQAKQLCACFFLKREFRKTWSSWTKRKFKWMPTAMLSKQSRGGSREGRRSKRPHPSLCHSKVQRLHHHDRFLRSYHTFITLIDFHREESRWGLFGNCLLHFCLKGDRCWCASAPS